MENRRSFLKKILGGAAALVVGTKGVEYVNTPETAEDIRIRVASMPGMHEGGVIELTEKELLKAGYDLDAGEHKKD